MRRRLVLLAALCSMLAAAPGAGAETVTLPGDAATGAGQNSQIYQVACPAAGDCVGVGYYNDVLGNHQALIDSEAGGVWSAGEVSDASLPTAGAPPQPELTSVACAALGSCVASDAFDESTSDEQGLIDMEINGAWTPTVAPLGGLPSVYTNPGVEVTPVSCPAVAGCVAVGNYGDGSDSLQGLIETQTASGWSASQAPWPQPSTDAAHFAPDFYDLSCASAGNCAAVGFYTDSAGDQQGLLESDSGGRWSAAELDLSNLGPATDPLASVLAVSCPAAGACTAVGTYQDAAGAYAGFAVSQSAGVWQPAVALALPAGSATTPDASGDPVQNDLYLNGVSCAAAGSCTAVGSYDATAANRIEAFSVTASGGVWARGEELSLPAGADAAATDPAAALYSVTCAAPGECLAAGTYAAAGGGSVALVARQSAGGWVAAGAGLAATYDASLANMYWASVACAPGGYCAAGGYAADGATGTERAFMLDAPAAPVKPEASVSGSLAVVSWSAPADSGGLPLSGYTVTAADLSRQGAGGQAVSVPASVTSATVGGLVAGDAYVFTVTATSLLGTGLPASSASVSVPPPPSASTGGGSGVQPAVPARPQLPAPAPARASRRPSRAQLLRALAGLLRPRAHGAALIRCLRSARGCSLRPVSLGQGRVSVRWYRVSGRGGRRRRTLFAQASARARGAHPVRLALRLTGSGRRLLGRRGRLRLIAVVSLGGGAPAASRSIALTIAVGAAGPRRRSAATLRQAPDGVRQHAHSSG